MANSSITHEYEATVFDWHPTERILAIGWADGMKNLDIIVKNCIVTCFIHVLIDEFVGMVSCWTVDGKNKPTSTFLESVTLISVGFKGIFTFFMLSTAAVA